LPIEDAEMTRMVRREIGRRYIDSSSLEVRVMHGVVHLRGWVDQLTGHHHKIDLKDELTIVQRILMQKPGIREVILEVEFGKIHRLASRRPKR